MSCTNGAITAILQKNMISARKHRIPSTVSSFSWDPQRYDKDVLARAQIGSMPSHRSRASTTPAKSEEEPKSAKKNAKKNARGKSPVARPRMSVFDDDVDVQEREAWVRFQYIDISL